MLVNVNSYVVNMFIPSLSAAKLLQKNQICKYLGKKINLLAFLRVGALEMLL